MPKKSSYFDLKEFKILKKLNSSSKVQDFINAIPMNFEKRKETCRSPLMALRRNEAHCMEGAMLAAACFWYHGGKPLLLDLKTTDKDDDHVVALFRYRNRWGAVSKTNHAVLRYRDPIFKTVRELALSYFNEYFLDNGKKTLRSYSKPFSLRQFNEGWLVSGDDLWNIADALDNAHHYAIADKKNIRQLRLADEIEIKAGKLVEWRK